MNWKLITNKNVMAGRSHLLYRYIPDNSFTLSIVWQISKVEWGLTTEKGDVVYRDELLFDESEIKYAFILNSILEKAEQIVFRQMKTSQFVENLTYTQDDKYKLISWEKYSRDSKNLAAKLYHYTQRASWCGEKNITLLALGRGGLPVGTIVSHQNDWPLALINISSYEQEEQKEIYCSDIIWPNKHKEKNTIVIIDDLVDSGKSIEYVSEKRLGKNLKQIFCFIIIATLYYKPRSIVKPTEYIEEVENDQWVVFPYEK